MAGVVTWGELLIFVFCCVVGSMPGGATDLCVCAFVCCGCPCTTTACWTCCFCFCCSCFTWSRRGQFQLTGCTFCCLSFCFCVCCCCVRICTTRSHRDGPNNPNSSLNSSTLSGSGRAATKMGGRHRRMSVCSLSPACLSAVATG